MARREITDLASLGALQDGKVNAQFSTHLKAILADAMGRATLEEKRELSMTVSIVPTVDEQGEVVGVKTQVSFKLKLPAAKTREFSMGCAGKDGEVLGLVYDELSFDDHRQSTLELNSQATE